MQQFFTNHTYHLSDEDIALYADALYFDKTREVPSHIRQHMKTCSRCATETFELYKILKQTRPSKNQKHPFFAGTGRTIKLSLLIKIAAGFIIVLTISSLGYYLFYPSSNKILTDRLIDKKEQHSDSCGKNNNKKIVTTENAGGTKNIEQQYRKYMFKTNPRLKILEPKHPYDMVEDKIILRYKYEGKEPLQIIIYNKEGKQTYSSQLSKGFFRMEKTLAPGIYYYKIKDKRNIIFAIGKINLTK
jgi:hypothetical protein